MSAPPSSSSAPTGPNPLSGGCPVAHDQRNNAMAGGCPVAKEPSASSTPRSAASGSSAYSTNQSFAGLNAAGEIAAPNAIPAAGRGNSDDGKNWVNPSANQLFRALARKDKAIEAKDADSVAAVHVAVTDNTWNCIMEYEQLHEK